MAERSAVIGIGQMKYARSRADVPLARPLREAALRALKDAALGWKDIYVIVIREGARRAEGVGDAGAVAARRRPAPPAS